MSIINQALQKAQREQLAQHPHHLSYVLAGHQRRAARRQWLRLQVGGGVLLVVGYLAYVWFSPLSPRVAGLPEPAPAIQGPPVEPPRREPPQPEPVAVEPVASPLPPLPTPTSSPADTVARQEPETPPLRVLAVESTPSPAVTPLPRVAPLPLPFPTATPPAPAQDSPPAPMSEPSAIDTARGQALLQRGLAAQATGDLKRALTLLEQAVKLDPTAKAAYNSLGNVYFQQKRFPQAVHMYQQALALDPNYAKARINLGSTYTQMALHDQAIAELQHALSAEESTPLAYYNLACVYARQGDSTTAAQYLQQAIILDPQARLWARTDADFTQVRQAPIVQQLLGP